MTALILGLGVGRYRLLRWLNQRSCTGDRVALASVGTAGLVLLLVIVMTLPWRLVWAPGNERVRIGSDRGYVLHETDRVLVVYNADTRTTATYDKAEPSIQKLGVLGYVFEEQQVFASNLPKCTITYP